MILGSSLALAACGAEASGAGPRADPGITRVSAEPVSVEDRPPAAASPVTIRVTNDTGSAVVLERHFGPAEPIGIAWLDGDLAPGVDLDQQDDARSGGWLATCQCACGAGPCPECEPPADVRVTLQPGESDDFPWSGRLRRQEEHPQGGACWSTFDPPRGRFVLTACTEDHVCGRAEVSLPASATIEIPLSRRATVSSCGDVRPRAMVSARARLLDTLRVVLRDRPIDRCPVVATCVTPAGLGRAMEEARGEACTIFVVPRGPELEVRAFLPLPLGTNGGESYTHVYDPDATHLLRARYEQ